MPLFERFNALFIHIPRTGGTNLENLLSLNAKWPEAAPDELFGPYLHNNKPFTLQHLTAEEILTNGFLTAEQFSRLFKFSVVRNPYDRCASLYFYWKKANDFDCYEAFLDYLGSLKMNDAEHGVGHSNETYHFLPQYKYLCDAKGKLLVDHVCRFENYQEEVKWLLKSIGCKTSRNLFDAEVHAKRAERYLGIYNKTTRDMVRSIYAIDFEMCNYSELPGGRFGSDLSVPQRFPGYQVTDRGDKLLFEDASRRRSFLLNRWAFLVWSLCDGHRSTGAIQRLLQEAFPEEAAQVIGDLKAVIKALVRLGALKLD